MNEVRIRLCDPGDVELIGDLSIAAWEPAFESMEKVLGPRIFHLIWPDWRKAQREGVEGACGRRTSTTLWLPNSTAASSGSSPTS